MDPVFEERVVSQVAPRLRRRVLVGPCSGVELWGYDGAGERGPRPAFSACGSSNRRRSERCSAQVPAAACPKSAAALDQEERRPDRGMRGGTRPAADPYDRRRRPTLADNGS